MCPYFRTARELPPARIKRNPTFLMFCSKNKPGRYGMGRKEEDTGFICIACKKEVKRLNRGSYRNHCPFCLASLHVDDKVPGDRKSRCQGAMNACRLVKSGKKGWQILHQCSKCGAIKANKIVENGDQPDDWRQIIVLSLKQ